MAVISTLRCGRLLAIGAAVVAVVVVAAADAGAAMDFATVDDLMLRLMATDNVPGAALALVKNGEIVLEKGYGFRDLAAQAPVTPTTLFNIGSITKSFTALSIAQLVDQHQLDLDTPVVKYLADFRLSDPHAQQVVTLRQLLSQSSGLPPDEQWAAQVPTTRQGIAAEFAAMPISALPGTRFQYCSRCIVLAAYILERVTGQSWEAYTQAHIFEPLRMTTASFGPQGLEDAPDRAVPYRHDPVSGEVLVPWDRLQYLEPLAPGGGIDATIDDLAHYALLQLGDGTVSGQRLVSAQMMAELHRPEIAVGADWPENRRFQNLHYALGWFIGETHSISLVFHNGANPGYRASIFLVPSAQAGVVILTNGESDAFAQKAMPSLIQQLLKPSTAN